MSEIENYIIRIQEVLADKNNIEVTGDLRKGQINVGLNWDTTSEAQQLLTVIRQMQKELGQIRKELNAEVDEIRDDYKDKSAKVQPGLMSSLFGGKGKQRSDVASQKREIQRKQGNELSSYDNLKLFIDNMLVRMDGYKLELQKWIKQNS